MAGVLCPDRGGLDISIQTKAVGSPYSYMELTGFQMRNVYDRTKTGNRSVNRWREATVG